VFGAVTQKNFLDASAEAKKLMQKQEPTIIGRGPDLAGVSCFKMKFGPADTSQLHFTDLRAVQPWDVVIEVIRYVELRVERLGRMCCCPKWVPVDYNGGGLIGVFPHILYYDHNSCRTRAKVFLAKLSKNRRCTGPIFRLAARPVGVPGGIFSQMKFGLIDHT
jgi:hypothetical protein